MGRYYCGDIEGKFTLGVQASNTADQFGVEGFQPSCLVYDFFTEDLPKVQAGLAKLEKQASKILKVKENPFVKEDGFYSLPRTKDTELNKKLLLLESDYSLGKQIEECLLQNGQCHFEAEL